MMTTTAATTWNNDNAATKEKKRSLVLRCPFFAGWMTFSAIFDNDNNCSHRIWQRQHPQLLHVMTTAAAQENKISFVLRFPFVVLLFPGWMTFSAAFKDNNNHSHCIQWIEQLQPLHLTMTTAATKERKRSLVLRFPFLQGGWLFPSNLSTLLPSITANHLPSLSANLLPSLVDKFVTSLFDDFLRTCLLTLLPSLLTLLSFLADSASFLADWGYLPLVIHKGFIWQKLPLGWSPSSSFGCNWSDCFKKTCDTC